jgi:hypothetical protein
VPLHISETGGLTLADLWLQVRRRKHLKKTVCLIVDYLQIMGGDGRQAYVFREEYYVARREPSASQASAHLEWQDDLKRTAPRSDRGAMPSANPRSRLWQNSAATCWPTI